MKEYRRIVTFKFKEKKYQLFLDKQNKYFFLRINSNNKYEYITLKELLQLEKVFCDFPLIMKAVDDNKKTAKFVFTPKIYINGLLYVLTCTTFLSGCRFLLNKNSDDEVYKLLTSSQAYSDTYDEKSKTSLMDDQLSFADQNDEVNDITNTEAQFGLFDLDTPLEIETFYESDWLNYLYIYDMAYLNKIFNYETVTPQEIYSVINANLKIPDNFKHLVREFVDANIRQYPDCEMRVLYENLKTLEIVECDEMELMMASLSVDACACYIRTENKIYVLKGCEYKKGTWDYQVIFHELTHVLRTACLTSGDKEIKIQCEGLSISGVTTAEALNSLYAVSLFDYEEKDIAYQLQSNYYGVMLECMNNYSLSDYINHSLSYFASKLDEENGHTNYAKGLLELIETQYKDFHNDSISVEQTEYYPIYDYIANMYFKKYINADMTYSEAEEVVKNLIEKIM